MTCSLEHSTLHKFNRCLLAWLRRWIRAITTIMNLTGVPVESLLFCSARDGAITSSEEVEALWRRLGELRRDGALMACTTYRGCQGSCYPWCCRCRRSMPDIGWVEVLSPCAIAHLLNPVCPHSRWVGRAWIQLATGEGQVRGLEPYYSRACDGMELAHYQPNPRKRVWSLFARVYIIGHGAQICIRI